MLDDLKKRLESIDDIKKKVYDDAFAEFEKFRKAFFEKYPDRKSFSWSQYTPSWNDGDVCYFNTYYDGGLEIDRERIDETEDEVLQAQGEEVVKFLHQLEKAVGSDFFQERWGDPATVYATKDKVSTSECYHY